MTWHMFGKTHSSTQTMVTLSIGSGLSSEGVWIATCTNHRGSKEV